MKDTEVAVFRALVDKLRTTSARCRRLGAAGYMNRAEGLDAGAEAIEEVLSAMPEAEATAAATTASQLAAFETLMRWDADGEHTRRQIFAATDEEPGLRAIAAEWGNGELKLGEGITYGAAALDLVTKLGLSPQPYVHIQAHDSLERYGMGHPNEKPCAQCGMVICEHQSGGGG